MTNDLKRYAYHIKELYDLPDKTKIVFFKNPEKYNTIFIEDINPSHKKIIYGKHKHNKHCGIEKIAKIIIPCLFLSELITFGIIYSYYNYSIFVFSLIIGLFISDYIIKLKLAIDKLFKFYDIDLSKPCF